MPPHLAERGVKQVDAGTFTFHPRPAWMLLAIPRAQGDLRIVLVLVAVPALVANFVQANNNRRRVVEPLDTAYDLTDTSQVVVATDLQRCHQLSTRAF